MLLLALLQGCGPGTGGTGLPPAAADLGAPATNAPSVALPDRPADLAGPIERFDATVIRIAGTDLPRDGTDLVFEDGSATTDAALRVGAQARAWRVDTGWRVAIQR
jgi:hypothetical protein